MNQNRGRFGRPWVVVRCIGWTVALLLLPAVAAVAQGDREREAWKEKIEHLLRQAEELEEEGRRDKAEALRRQAHELMQRLERRGREENGGAEELHEILEGLEHGIGALKRLGRHEEAQRLHRIANEVREKLADRKHHREGGDEERAIAEKRIEIMAWAMRALQEEDRHELAERLEHAIHALKLDLEGRRDEEARRIRETAPRPGEQAEILSHAAGILREYGKHDAAGAVEKLARDLAPHRKEGEHHREGGDERGTLEHRLEIMRLAMKALREGERRDAVELMERVIHALEVTLEGRRDEEARRIREKAPGPEDQVELLRLAADLYLEFGMEDRARMIDELAREMQPHREGRREHRGERPERERRHEEEREREPNRLERVERDLAELQRAINRLAEELKRMRRDDY